MRKSPPRSTTTTKVDKTWELHREWIGNRHPGQLFLPFALFIITAFVYVRTLSPTVAGGDSGDLTVAAAVGGVAHPPGYPLLTLINRFFILFPIGSIAYRINLASAVFGAGAVLLLYLIVRELRAGTLPGIIAGFSLAFSLLFWSYSVVAEVFALNSFIVLFAILLLLFWEKRKDDRLLYVFFLANGLGMSHHHSIVLLWPGFAYFILSSGGISLFTLKRICFSTVAFLAGLTPYIYIPLAVASHPYYNWDNANTLDRFITLVTRADYGTFSLHLGGEGGFEFPRLAQIPLFLQALLDGFTPIGTIFGILGGVFLFRRQKRFFYLFLVSVLLTGPVFVTYANVDFDIPGALQILHKFYLLHFTLFAALIGYGVGGVTEYLKGRYQAKGNFIGFGIAVVSFSIPLVLLVSNYGTVDQSQRFLAYNLGTDILRPLPKNSLLVAFGDEGWFDSEYLQLVDRIRPDVAVVSAGLLDKEWYREQVRERYSSQFVPEENLLDRRDTVSSVVRDRLHKGLPVYFTGTLAEDFEKDFRMAPQGVLLQVLPKETPINLDQVRAANAGLWGQYANTQELGKSYRNGSWEAKVVNYYSMPILYLAMAYDRSGRYDDAVALYSRVLEISPNFSRPYDYLGSIYFRVKHDNVKALQYYEKFLEVQPYSPPADEIRNDVTMIKARLSPR